LTISVPIRLDENSTICHLASDPITPPSEMAKRSPRIVTSSLIGS
jgi:hypothetical protein